MKFLGVSGLAIQGRSRTAANGNKKIPAAVLIAGGEEGGSHKCSGRVR